MTTLISSTAPRRRKSAPSSAARATWKRYYRALRVARRESLKAFVDCMTFGSGFVMISADGSVKRLDPATVWIDTK
jgi:hypothetical protein